MITLINNSVLTLENGRFYTISRNSSSTARCLENEE
ncbi:hypothetical protein X975_10885, partial [Stegodyphus mimosarum]